MNVEELRAAERFTAITSLSATFAGTPITIVNLSTIGAQIEHPAPIRLGTVARFVIRRGDVSIDVRGLLTWSRLSKTPDAQGQHAYRSGLRIESGNAEYALALHMLIKGGTMRREPDTLEKKRRRLLERMTERSRPAMKLVSQSGDIPPDQVLLVQHARERLRAEPEEAQKWYHRAKYAITHGATNIEIETIRDREEVLAVWEYLERSIDIPTIARAFELTRIR
ncbi:MAG TPA: hypothetical protein VM779_12205 [Thermoanaerobaculia bacterium]|nr:hypothetical protein [Thermoanaerobaculia bacterium]